jgi:hypothetical protein
MNTSRFRLGLVLPLLCLSAVAYAADKDPIAEQLSYDGLEKISVDGIDMAYARPGASLAPYTQVMIAPVSVSFAKNWQRDQQANNYRLSTSEIERIRTTVAKDVEQSFIKEMKDGGYNVVSQPGPKVLLVRPVILNLYVNAPDVMTAGRSRTYTASAGEMTLAAELIDSETGQVEARVLDRTRAREYPKFTISNRVTNSAEAQRAASEWARILRGALDKSKKIGQG